MKETEHSWKEVRYTGEMPHLIKKWTRLIGPGVAMTASGVGVGDLVAASVAGSEFGLALLWTIPVGIILKFCLNEGIARWQLATGFTLFEGWVKCFGNWVRYYFLVYLMIWSFVVGAALMSACGMAAHAIWPTVSVSTWAVIHSLAALSLIFWGNYQVFERMTKLLVALMFITLVGISFFLFPPWQLLVTGMRELSIPNGSVKPILSVMGGIGGSVSLLYYGYWMRARGWIGAEHTKAVRFDLSVCYLLTGLFGLALMSLAAKLFHSTQTLLNNQHWVAQMGLLLRSHAGPMGSWIFLIGFWATVTSSMLGTWQGLPYLFCDLIYLTPAKTISTASPYYRGALLCISILPIPVLFVPGGTPIFLIVAFTIVGSLFMPFLAGSLLVMNSQWVVSDLRSKAISNAVLVLGILFFICLSVQELIDR